MEVENIMISVEGVIKLALAVKNPPDNAGDGGDAGLIFGSGRSPGGGHGNPLQYCCLGNPMDRGTWRARACRFESGMTEVT